MTVKRRGLVRRRWIILLFLKKKVLKLFENTGFRINGGANDYKKQL
ncbi:MAG: hypothetical protein C5S38_06300 [Candidatus Methanophagaceae archaeon]|nr:MAG: hypothetical protein C5S38_06300 [Methanophagales archaeon]